MVGHRITGFTFIEVLIVLMVVSLGLIGVIGLIIYGNRLSSKAQGRMMATATAISVVHDPQPKLDPGVAADWVYNPYPDFDNGAIDQISTATGYINGLYVRREERSAPADIISMSATTSRVYARSALVTVEVYETVGGTAVASFSKRVVRQRVAP